MVIAFSPGSQSRLKEQGKASHTAHTSQARCLEKTPHLASSLLPSLRPFATNAKTPIDSSSLPR